MSSYAQSQRASRDQTLASHSQQQQQQEPRPTSPAQTRSDSQTLFANRPAADNNRTTTTLAVDEQTQQPRQATQTPPPKGEAEPNKCWICFSDSTEDTPETSPWRSPCPCALVAHEECLLDWIADMEAPNSRRARSLAAPKIECPQCKSEIKLSRPRNLVVDGVRRLERLGGQLVTPGALTVLLGMLVNSSMAWGVHSVFAVFGQEDGIRILQPLFHHRSLPPIIIGRNSGPSIARQIVENVAREAAHYIRQWRLYIGLPLITPMLILSRTSLADTILPVMPIIFFATQIPSPEESFDFTSWPPSASLAFSVLPYLRQGYNYYYSKVWAPKERQWLREIQPRTSQDGANAANGNAGQEQQDELDPLAPRADDDNLLDIRIDAGIWNDWEDEDDNEDAAAVEQAVDAAIEEAAQRQQQQNLAEQPLQPQGQPQPAGQQQPENAQQPGVQQQQQPQQPQQAAPAAAGERRLSYSVTAIAETVLGAIVFPTVAGISGELLRLWLPRAWTTPPRSTFLGGRMPAKGLLQEKWGRSLVGGCLFVVLKDAVMLYVRWKMAQMHRGRKVLDYAGANARKGRA